jgi:pyruvate,orthophosphate dikinase
VNAVREPVLPRVVDADLAAVGAPVPCEVVTTAHQDPGTLAGLLREAVAQIRAAAAGQPPVLFAVRAWPTDAWRPRIEYAGLTADTYAWLAGRIGDAAAARRVQPMERILEQAGHDHPWRAGLIDQLAAAACAVGTPHVAISQLVLGFCADGDGTGLACSHDPGTGRPGLAGSFWPARRDGFQPGDTAGQSWLAAADAPWLPRLTEVIAALSGRCRDAVEVDLAVQRGELFIPAWRRLRRSPRAACVIAAGLGRQATISGTEILRRVTAEAFSAALLGTGQALPAEAVLARGLGISPGVAVGRATFDTDRAERLAAEGTPVVLVRQETRPEDVPAMMAAAAIVTVRGGYTSHAAVIARMMGRPCVTGLATATIESPHGPLGLGTHVISDGDLIAVHGGDGTIATGEAVASGHAANRPDAELSAALDTMTAAADGQRRLGVRANADTAAEALEARRNGATGVGLCRTEHMFLGDRQKLLEDVLLTHDRTTRDALDELRRFQQAEFRAILEAMDGLPVTIRLLDPPVHEFLPDLADLSVKVTAAEAAGGATLGDKRRLATVRRMTERNPMLGIRGIRLGLLLPSLYEMQVRALLDATADRLVAGGDPRPEILVPMVSTAAELAPVRGYADRVAGEVRQLVEPALGVPVGSMIEVPRAALTAAQLADAVDFFSIGTNDLTQMTWGLSRDDADKRLLSTYQQLGLIKESPFKTIDTDGVGALISAAVRAARGRRPGIEIGVCGEHAADPASIQFFHEAGVDYISCAPPFIPLARYAAGRAAVLARDGGSR